MSQRKAPSRALHVIDTGGPGGAETVLASIVTALPEAWQSKVIIPEDDWLAARLREAGSDVVILPSEGSADVAFLGSLARTILRFRPHVIHAHLFTSGVYASLASRLVRGPGVICTFHGAADVDPDDRLVRVKSRILRRRRNRIVYVSHQLREHLEPLLGIPESLGAVVHNGIDFEGPVEGAHVRRELEVDPETPLVGAIGNLRSPKDYPNLVRAARLVVDRRPDVRFVVAGEGSGALRDELEGLVDELGLDRHVRFLGFRTDVDRLIASFDLFVSSSSSEGLPLATLEALGHGLPAVLTDCGGPGEIVEDARTGWLVPPRDPEALAEGVLRALADPDRAREMGGAAKTEVRARFGRQTMIDRYLELYEAVS